MNFEEERVLYEFLKKEFAALSQPHEAKWIFEELKKLDYSQAKIKAEEIVQRRKKNEPLAYILGHWDFRKQRLAVGPGVLIPRPETEELVEHVLEHLRVNKHHNVIADLGSGTGAIVYALCNESPKLLELYAVEKSWDAFIYLEKNLKMFSLEKQKRVHLIHSDWEDVELPMLDIIVSNPPYVSSEEYMALDVGVSAYEPKRALVPEDEIDPMSAYKSILSLASKKLKKGGAIFFEFGPAQEGLWEPLLKDFSYKIFKDLSDKPRFIYAFDFATKSR